MARKGLSIRCYRIGVIGMLKRKFFNCFRFLFLLIPILYLITGCTVVNIPKECNLVTESELRVRKNPNFDSSSTIRSDVNAIVIRGERAYVGFGNSIVILDVTNPSEPGQISSISLPVEEVLVLNLIGDYLYVNWQDPTGGMYIIDVSDPLHPIEVGCQEENLFQLAGATLSGDYAYLPLGDEGKGGFLIYDVTNPSEVIEVGAYQPETVGRFSNSPLFESQPKIVTSVGISGDYAYIGENFPGGDSLYRGQVRILDVATPENPELVGVYNMPYETGVTHIVAVDKYVFASANGWIVDRELTIILDVSDPASPIELYEFSSALMATSFREFAYLIESGKIAIWDYSDPSSPIQAGSIDLPPMVYVGTNDIITSGDYLYVAMKGAGLQIYNNVNPSRPIKISSFP